jgi:hypothetical protein
MLVFSKMEQLLKNNNLLQMYDLIPDEIKKDFKRRSQDFIKKNSLTAWKDFLRSWYKKEDASTPKGIRDYFQSMFRHMRDVNKGLSNKKKWYYGRKKIKRKSNMVKEKLSQSLKKKCKKNKVRLTVKRKGKRVYKSVKVLKKQCEKAMKKKKTVKRKRKFGASRHGGRVVPVNSHFGRPYFGYTTTSRASRFGSRRPEFHYPEHVLTGYNTAKTNKKFRFGRPHRHPLRYSHYNPSKTGKKFRFGKVKPLLDGYAMDEAANDAAGFMFANPVGGFLPWSFLGTKAGNRSDPERIAFFMSSAKKKGKKKMSEAQAKKYLKIIDKIIQKKKITEKEKDFVVSFKLFSKKKLNRTIWCIKNPGKCGGIKFLIELSGQVGMHAAVVAFLIGGMTLAYKVYDYLKGNTRRGNSPLVSDQNQGVPPPRGLISRRRQEHRQRETYLTMFRSLKNYLVIANGFGRREQNNDNDFIDRKMDELVVDFLRELYSTDEEIQSLPQETLDGYKRLFVSSYFQGLNNEEPTISASIDYLISRIEAGTISIDQLNSGIFSVQNQRGQETNIAIPVQTIRPIHVDEMVGMGSLPTVSHLEEVPMGTIENSSNANRLVGPDNEHLNAYGRRKRKKVKRKRKKVKRKRKKVKRKRRKVKRKKIKK